MLSKVKFVGMFIFGLVFLISLLIASILPISMLGSVLFKIFNLRFFFLGTILKFSILGLVINLLCWLLAIFYAIVSSLIINPNPVFAAIGGLVYIVFGMLSALCGSLMYIYYINMI